MIGKKSGKWARRWLYTFAKKPRKKIKRSYLKLLEEHSAIHLKFQNITLQTYFTLKIWDLIDF